MNFRSRKWSLILLLLIAFAELGADFSAYSGNDLITTVFTIIGSFLIITLFIQLLTQKGDWVFRSAVLIPLIGYVAFKFYVLFVFLTQVD